MMERHARIDRVEDAPGAPRAAQGATARAAAAVLASPIPLAAVLTIGIAARCRQYLGNPSYWYDEAYVILNVIEKPFHALVGPLELQQVAPPLFLWMLRGLYLIAGTPEPVMRLPAMVCGLVALPLMIPLAQRVVGNPGWAWAVAFLAVSYHAVVHTCEVKPYAGDLLVTQAILVAAQACLTGSGVQRRCWVALCAAAVLAPWMSFPSVFVLCGGGLAVLTAIMRRRERAVWMWWVTFVALLSVSSLVLWYGAARYHNSPQQQAAFARHFINASSLGAALASTVSCLIGLGSYASTAIGVPLLLFGGLGAVVLSRRSPALVMLLVSPLGIAGLAAALRSYPLGDRLGLFAAPCIWLLAAAGIGATTQRLRGRFAGAGWLVLALLLLPDGIRTTQSLIVVQPQADFRSAFAYVQQHRLPGDTLWVSHPEVYEVYFGKEPPILGAYTDPDVVERAALAGRLWLVYTPQGPNRTNFPAVFERLLAVHSVPALRHEVAGLEVVLYVPGGGQR